MKNTISLKHAIPTHDYRPALEGALSWLGKRYLLAEPLNRRSDDRPANTEAARPFDRAASVVNT